MVIVFDDTDDLVRWCGSPKDQHVRRVNRHDFNLVARDNCLQLLEFGDATGYFGSLLDNGGLGFPVAVQDESSASKA